MRQYSSDQLDKLAEALAKAQGQISHASKAVKNEFFKSRYADLPAVYDASRKALSENGLAVTQLTDSDEQGITLVSTLIHSSGQWIRSWYPVRPVKQDPQGLGSALTYARRYSYAALVGVAANDEDDDGNAASGLSVNENKGVFKNASERNKFCENVISSFNEAQTADELRTLADLNAAKFKEMDGGNDADQMGVGELRKRYKAASERFKESNHRNPRMLDPKDELDRRAEILVS